MQISNNNKPRTLDETPVSELVGAAQQASFLALLGRTAAEEEPLTPHLRTSHHGEATAHLPAPRQTNNLAMADQLHLRLTNGALAGMVLEAHQQAGKLSLRLRLSSAQQNAHDGATLARFKHELAEHFGSPLYVEFLDHDAPTD